MLQRNRFAGKAKEARLVILPQEEGQEQDQGTIHKLWWWVIYTCNCFRYPGIYLPLYPFSLWRCDKSRLVQGARYRMQGEAGQESKQWQVRIWKVQVRKVNSREHARGSTLSRRRILIVPTRSHHFDMRRFKIFLPHCAWWSCLIESLFKHSKRHDCRRF